MPLRTPAIATQCCAPECHLISTAIGRFAAISVLICASVREECPGLFQLPLMFSASPTPPDLMQTAGMPASGLPRTLCAFFASGSARAVANLGSDARAAVSGQHSVVEGHLLIAWPTVVMMEHCVAVLAES